jgi:TolB protein
MRKLTPIFLLIFSACSHSPVKALPQEVRPGPNERHFKNLKQLTFEGTFAEAYFSPDGKQLVFQGRKPGQGCDQIFRMNSDGSDVRKISNGGRATCSFFIAPDRILYSSTHEAGDACPKEHDRSKGYIWDIFKSYDIYTANTDGGDLKPLTREWGYDAESTVCGGKITFASARSGDSVHVYTMNTDGSHVTKLTHAMGYNGGPFFSHDCSRIVYRAATPKTKEEKAQFTTAIREGFIPQGNLELHVMSVQGKHDVTLTNYRKSSFAPSFYPQGDKIIFSSNYSKADDPLHQRVFHLWTVDSRKPMQTTAEPITSEGTFNGFPMFSPDGKFLVFASNRNSANPHELQIFIAEWQN